MPSFLKPLVRSALRKKYRKLPGLHLTRALPFLRGPKERLINWLQDDPVTVQGSTMYLDAVDSLGLRRRGIYEPAETALVRANVRPGDTALDIGANVGYYTLLLEKLVGPQGKVIAFEPDPRCFALLKRNVEANGLTHVTLHQAAVCDTPGELTLHVSELNTGDNRLHANDARRLACKVPAVKLDQLLEKAGAINFIKMDVQGAEAAAVRGMKTLLARQASTGFLMEFSPDGLRDSGDEPAILLQELESLGFVLRRILPENSATAKTLAELREQVKRGAFPELNLWMTKGRSSSQAA